MPVKPGEMLQADLADAPGGGARVTDCDIMDPLMAYCEKIGGHGLSPVEAFNLMKQMLRSKGIAVEPEGGGKEGRGEK